MTRFSFDRGDDDRNEIARCNRDEARTARHGLTEQQRDQGCRHHDIGRTGQCRWCGEQIVTREET